MAALFGGEGALHRTVEMFGLVEAGDFAQPGAFCRQALFDFLIVLDFNEIGRHYLPPAYAVV